MALVSAVEVFSAVPVLLNFTVIPGFSFSNSAMIWFMEFPESHPQTVIVPFALPVSVPDELVLPQAPKPASIAADATAAKIFLIFRIFTPLRVLPPGGPAVAAPEAYTLSPRFLYF